MTTNYIYSVLSIFVQQYGFYLLVILMAIGVLCYIKYQYQKQYRLKNNYWMYCTKSILTNNEKDFYLTIEKALPAGYRVSTQVSMGAVVKLSSKVHSSKSLGYRSKFDKKIIDFVVLNPNLEVCLLIELDDRTHNKTTDQNRDSITKNAGYTTLRVQSKAKPTVTELNKKIKDALNN